MESIDKSDTTIYDWAREEGNYPLKKIIALANLASSQKPANIPTFQKELGNKNPVMRYWAALGLRVLGKDAARAEAELIQASKDSDPSVRITALTTLGKIKGSETYTEALLEEAATAKGDMHCSWALGGLKFLEYQSLKDHPNSANPSTSTKAPTPTAAHKTFSSAKPTPTCLNDKHTQRRKDAKAFHQREPYPRVAAFNFSLFSLHSSGFYRAADDRSKCKLQRPTV